MRRSVEDLSDSPRDSGKLIANSWKTPGISLQYLIDHPAVSLSVSHSLSHSLSGPLRVGGVGVSHPVEKLCWQVLPPVNLRLFLGSFAAFRHKLTPALAHVVC